MHEREADTAPVVVVSGLPRSGTSMMMAMLEAGGMPVLADGARPADADNPRGYFEFARAKAPATGWLAQARGKAVKIISLHLLDLPAAHRYAIIYMERPLEQILASQRQMLARRGQPAPGDDTQLCDLYERHLDRVKRWLSVQPHLQVRYLDFGRTVGDPDGAARTVKRFLDTPLDTAAMAAAVDPALYHHRV